MPPMKAVKSAPDYGSTEDEDSGKEFGKDSSVDKEFEFSHGLTSQEALQRLNVYGKNELPEKVVPKWYIFISQLWQPMPIMIWLAAIIEAAINNYLDMSILLFIQFANASISYYEITKAGDAVAALKKSLKPEATVKRDGKWVIMDAALVVPGDLVLLATGGAIPADCRVNEGQCDVDQAQLTGESIPVTMFKGDSCKMGSTVVRGEVEGTVEFTGGETFFGKTATLLQGPQELSNLQKILVDIILIIVFLSTTLCTIVFIYLLNHTDPIDALSFVVVLMVASIPLAIEIVTTTTLALGSKELAHHGAIVTRLVAIEDMAGMAILCADKTGTLTMNKMEIQPETPIYNGVETQYSLLRYAAMAARWKEPPKDALDKLVLNAVDMPSMETVKQTDYLPFDPVIKRTEGSVTDLTTGESYKVTKGAPHVLLKLCDDPDGSLHKKVNKDITDYGNRGVRCVAVAKTNKNGQWEMLGMLTFLDPPRPDTKQTIEDSRDYGVIVKMITGDHALIARETARRLGLGDLIRSAEGLPQLDADKKKPKDMAKNYGEMILWSDGFAQVFPEHKYLIVECLRELGYKVGMTGDGVNDAPALKRADVGIAVSGATDAARAAADIVLTREGLSTIVHGIITSRVIFARIRNFITYRVAATLQLLTFFFIAVFSFKPQDFQPNPETNHNFHDNTWPAYFHMPVLMLMLITLLNDGCLIAIGYDNVTPLKTPEVWNLRVVFFVGGVLAAVACFSSLILLYFLLDSWNPDGFFYKLGLGNISYGQITVAVYLSVSITDFLTLFSVRCGDDWLWTRMPSPVLGGAAILSMSASTVLSIVWPPSYPDGIYASGFMHNPPYQLAVFILLYCVVWWFIQDAFKVLTFYVLKKYNIFRINDTGAVVVDDISMARIQMESKKMISGGGGHH